MGHLAKPRDASFFRVFFNPYHYGVLTIMPAVRTFLIKLFFPLVKYPKTDIDKYPASDP